MLLATWFSPDQRSDAGWSDRVHGSDVHRDGELRSVFGDLMVVLNTTRNCSSSTRSCALGIFSTGASAPNTEGGCYVEVVSRSQGLGSGDVPVQPDDSRGF